MNKTWLLGSLFLGWSLIVLLYILLYLHAEEFFLWHLPHTALYANLCILVFTLLLLLLLIIFDNNAHGLHLLLLIIVLFLYNAGLFLHLRIAADKPVLIARFIDLVDPESEHRQLIDSAYIRTAQRFPEAGIDYGNKIAVYNDYIKSQLTLSNNSFWSKLTRFDFSSEEELETVKGKNRFTRRFLMTWLANANELIMTEFYKKRQSFIFAKTIRDQDLFDRYRVGKDDLKPLLALSRVHPEDRVPPEDLYPKLHRRVIPLILFLLILSFGSAARYLKIILMASLLLLAGISFWFNSALLSGIYTFLLLIVSLDRGRSNELINGFLDRGMEKIGVLFLVNVILVLLFRMFISDNGAYELLKVPLSFLLAAVGFKLSVETNKDHFIMLQNGRLIREGLFHIWGVSMAVLLLLLSAGLFVLLDFGQASVFALTVLLLLLFSAEYIKYSMSMVFLIASLIFGFYYLIVHGMNQGSFVFGLLHETLIANRWLLLLSMLLGMVFIILYWSSENYKNRRVLPAGAPKIFSSVTGLTQFSFLALLFSAAFLAAFGFIIPAFGDNLRAVERIGLFENIFNTGYLPFYRYDNLWDNSSNIHKALQGMAGSGLSGNLFFSGPEFIANADNDFIFSVIVEMFGFFGGMFILLLLVAVFFILNKIKNSVESLQKKLFILVFTSLLAASTVTTVFGQMLLLPLTGIPLPFVARGFSSAAAYFVLTAFLIIVYNKEKNEKTTEG